MSAESMPEAEKTPAGAVPPADAAGDLDLIHRIASLTRMLRENMRELGLDQAIKNAAEAIPDARDRLRYVAQMTEKAANRVLNATDAAGPIQDGLTRSARGLDERWEAWFARPIEMDAARQLVKDTRSLRCWAPTRVIGMP